MLSGPPGGQGRSTDGPWGEAALNFCTYQRRTRPGTETNPERLSLSLPPLALLCTRALPHICWALRKLPAAQWAGQAAGRGDREPGWSGSAHRFSEVVKVEGFSQLSNSVLFEAS